jgi:hypothetical protein
MKYMSATIPCVVCGKKPVDLHHPTSRGAGGTDESLMPLCRKHHAETHQIGCNTFADRHPNVRLWLRLNGFQYDGYSKKWFKKKEI